MTMLFLRAAVLAVVGVCATSPALAQSTSRFWIEALGSDHYKGKSRSSEAVLTLKFAHSWRYGDNFIFSDITAPHAYGKRGSTFTDWAPRISLGETLRGEPLAIGPFSDVYAMGKFNYSYTKAGTSTTTMGGLGVDIDAPGFAFLRMGLLHRDNHDIQGSTTQFSSSWNYPFQLGGRNFSFEGFLDYAGSEGDRKPWLHTQPQLVWRVNQQLGLGVEYQYWRNRLGIEGLKESVMQAMVRWNF